MEKFEPSSFNTHQEELKFLQTLGFPTNPDILEANSVEEAWSLAKEMESKESDFSYHIDGMVLKLNDNQLARDLGVVGKTPRAWCAVKFAAEEVTTKIKDVTWQVGRTGKLTPVAELEPTLLAGTVVKRATLHNYKEFLDSQLVPEDIVIIRKAGDIIPEIVQVLYNLRPDKSLKNFQPPTKCPSCQTELTISSTDVDLQCPNQLDCPAQVLGRLTYFAQRNIANISGLSEKMLSRFIAEYGVRDLPDLYQLPYNQIAELEGFGQKSTENLRRATDETRQLDDYRFLAGLCIEGIGLEVAKLICQVLENHQGQAKAGTGSKDELF